VSSGGQIFLQIKLTIISSVVMRVKTKLQKDKKFKERLANIENNILKGQTQT